MPATLMLLSNPYRPDPRVLRESRSLLGEGMEVKLIAWDREGSLAQREDAGGVHVLRTGPCSPFRSARRVMTSLPRFWLRALRLARRQTFDLIHSHDFDTLPLGLLLARLAGKPLLYDAHEIYSSMIRTEVGGLSRLIEPFEKSFARRADEVVTVNEILADWLSSGRRKRPRVVMNSPDPSVLRGVDPLEVRRRHGLKGFVLSYLGSLEPGRFVEELVSSFEPSSGVTVAIGGSGTLQPVAESASLKNPAVKFLGFIGMDEALRVTFASDLVVAMVDPSNVNYRLGTPVKILDAMACGRPVVTSRGIEFSKTVEDAGCGFVIPYDKSSFLKTVKEASESPRKLSEMGRRGKDYFERELSWERNKQELLLAYRNLLPKAV